MIIRVLVTVLLLSSIAMEASTLNEAFKNAKIDGYIRGSYQSHDIKGDKTYNDDAIGGKLHIETGEVYTISGGASFYTSNSIYYNDNRGLVPFRGENKKSYTILGEAYIKSEFGNSLIKIGRQEIDTPFAQIDDIGVVPNTFESAIFINKDILDTTIFLAQIQKMAGVDADIVDRFTNINENRGMQSFGVTYEGIKDLSLSGWYYNLDKAEISSISYLEANYENSSNIFSYGFGVQYAKENYREDKDSNIYGVNISGGINSIGLSLSSAYTKVNGNEASSGFGGGPFFSNSEYLIIDNAGANGRAFWYGLEYECSNIGVNGLNIGLGKVTLTTKDNKNATEIDFIASYKIDDNIEMHLIASNLDGDSVGEYNAKHIRIFANYNF